MTFLPPVPSTGRAGYRRAFGFIARTMTRAAIVFAMAALVGLGLGPFTGRYRVLTVLSGSMRPTLPIGSIVLSTPEPLNAVRVGQIISFRAPTPGGPVETHRVIEVVTGGDHPAVRTQGDANPVPDGWVARLGSGPVWKARVVAPGVGRLIHGLRSALVHRLTLWAAPLCFVAVALWEIWGRSAQREPHPG
ncbi:MAG: hypothetical protein NVS3B21_30240 [Acidimicrobiales bacterium]